MLWIFRNPTRAQRFPVLLVRDAEDGSLLARWQIGASMVFESELCARSFVKQLWTLTRMRAKRLVRRRVKWDAFGSALKESVIQGQTARTLNRRLACV
eukprot:g3510.t1